MTRTRGRRLYGPLSKVLERVRDRSPWNKGIPYSASYRPAIEELERREVMHAYLPLDALPDLSGDHDHDRGAIVAEVGELAISDVPAGTSRIAPAVWSPTNQNSHSTESFVAAPPILHSNPGAPVSLYLDFDGHYEANWGGYSNVSTPAFDRDGNPSTFSTAELAAMTEIWQRVSEDFAPFNIDVTTANPGSFADGVALRASIGGNGSWIGPYGGVAYVDSFTNYIANTVYIFADNYGGSQYAWAIADTVSHESGHGFGLLHQSLFDSQGRMTDEYHPGTSSRIYLMGGGDYLRSTWHNGLNGDGVSQDDMAVIARAANGFGFRPDDHGDSLSTGTTLSVANGQLAGSGIIARTSDVDVFSFSTGAGQINLRVDVTAVGPNLDTWIELYSAAGQFVAWAAPSTSLGATIATTAAAGSYRLTVRSAGAYGDVGQYTVSGTLVDLPAPEIAVLDGATELADGTSTVDYGFTVVGGSLVRTFTVRNAGTLTLTLGNSINLPSGFSLVGAFGSASLAPGASTTFSVRLDATAPGSYRGLVSFTNDDADESPFEFTIIGYVAASSSFDGIGNYNPSTGAWAVRNTPTAGSTDSSFAWGFIGTLPVSGDWNGDGRDEHGVYHPGSGTWFLLGMAPFAWGFTGTLPVSGDWNGDGRDEHGVYHPGSGTWFLPGTAPFAWGFTGTLPVSGDWNGDGRDEHGVYHPGSGTWFLLGMAPFAWGFTGTLPVTGDWNGDGRDEHGVYHPASSTWFLPGMASFVYGPADSNINPVVGRWRATSSASVAGTTSTTARLAAATTATHSVHSRTTVVPENTVDLPATLVPIPESAVDVVAESVRGRSTAPSDRRLGAARATAPASRGPARPAPSLAAHREDSSPRESCPGGDDAAVEAIDTLFSADVPTVDGYDWSPEGLDSDDIDAIFELDDEPYAFSP